MRRTADLTDSEREDLAAGQHARVAQALLARDRPDLAAEILEEIWDFAGAVEAHLQAGQLTSALEAALSAESPALLDRVIGTLLGDGDLSAREDAAGLLRARGRNAEAARLLEATQAPTDLRAEVLSDAGDELAAAEAWANDGEPGRALALLADSGRHDAPRWKLEARLHWDLGDAQGVARAAQRSLATDPDDRAVRELLARALVALGHDVAAQLVAPTELDPSADPLPGRYRVTAPLPASLAGAAYEGVDRVTLREVEVHLLLAEHPAEADDASLQQALERFADAARRGAGVGHPAIRPVIEIDPASGVMVLPRAEGPLLRQLIRPPGVSPARARSMIAFLLEGLAAANHHGLVHGAILPSQLVSDRVGRPLLGPFGTHWLRGLAATRTGSLGEVMHATAPELRRGAPPTLAGDIYALGALWRALVTGTIGASEPTGPDADLIRSIQVEDPAARPSPASLLIRLRQPIADPTKLGGRRASQQSIDLAAPETGTAQEGVRVIVPPSWDDEALAQVCAASDPWLQPILDRSGRVLVFAPWPGGCRTMADATPGWRDLVPPEALASLPQPARGEVERRLRPSSLVNTPGGVWMVALDDVLSR